MKRTIGILLLLQLFHIATAWVERLEVIIDCNYIENRTDSIEIIEKLKPLHTNNSSDSIQESACYTDLFKSELKNINRKNVKYLKLSVITSNSFLNENHILNNFDNVKFINGSHNDLMGISAYGFIGLKSLEEIDFSYSSIIFFSYLGKPSLDDSPIQRANFSNNKLFSFDGRDLYGIIGANIRILDLSHNQISFISKYSFERTKNLEVLRLDNNPLIIFNCQMLPSLKSLSVTITFDQIQILILYSAGCSIGTASNNKTQIELTLSGATYRLCNSKDCLKNVNRFSTNDTDNFSKIFDLLPSSLQELYLPSTNLKDFSVKMFEKFHDLTHLNLSHSNLTELQENTFANQKQIKILDLSYTNFMTSNSSAMFSSLENLQELDISHVDVKNMTELLQTLTPTIIAMDLSFNYVGQLNVTTFQRFTNLQRLNLSHTNLSNFGYNTFFNQTKLQFLDLSFNNLMRIDFQPFKKNFHFLDELKLEGNSLMDISTITPSTFPRLKVLAVSKNQLSCHTLAIFLHQWKHLKLISNASNQTHIGGIDCNLEEDDETNDDGEETTLALKVLHFLMPFKSETIVKNAKSVATIFSVLFWVLCLIGCRYVVVNLKLILRIKEKLTNCRFGINQTIRRTNSTIVFSEQEVY